VRGGDSGTKIDSLAGGQNASDIEDVEYIQKKLFAALKVPKAYLSYDEDIGAKATLAQEDIRFSRTIQRIQKTVISELNKIAMIHLYVHGFSDEELLEFELKLSNPSSVAQLQKLELISSRFDIAGKMPEGMLDRRWVQKNVLGLTDKEIIAIHEGRKEDKITDAEIESSGAAAEGGAEDLGGDEGGLFDADIEDNKNLLVTDSGSLLDKSYKDEWYEDDDWDDDIIDDDEEKESGSPIKPVSDVSRTKTSGGPLKTHMPDFKSMVTHSRSQDSMRMPYGTDTIKPSFEGLERNSGDIYTNMIGRPAMTPEMKSAFRSLVNILSPSGGVLLSEADLGKDFDLDYEYEAGDIDED
jgi:hypothetical protein